jgi:hypothetical protein
LNFERGANGGAIFSPNRNIKPEDVGWVRTLKDIIHPKHMVIRPYVDVPTILINVKDA